MSVGKPCKSLVELEALRVEVALLRRQVEVLCERLAVIDDVPGVCVDPHCECPGDCLAHWREWSAAKAKEGA